jgi:hypothetical protein
MLNTGMEIYELASKKGGTLPASSGLYESVKKTFKDAAAGNTYTDKDVWEIIKSDGIYYLRSRMFGSLFPLNTTWNVRMMGLNDNKSFFSLFLTG